MNSVVTERFSACVLELKKRKVVQSFRQFALRLDYFPQALSEILKGRRDVNIELLRKAVMNYHMNPFYLFTGQGPMFLKDQKMEDYRCLTVVTDEDKNEKIVYVPASQHHEYALKCSEPNYIQLLPTFTLPDVKYHNNQYRAFEVKGDAMEPTLHEGDKVIGHYINPDKWTKLLKANYVYILITAEELKMGRMGALDKEANILQLINDNRYYDIQKIKIDSIKELWCIDTKISPFLASPNILLSNLSQKLDEFSKTLNLQQEHFEHYIKSVDEFLNKKNSS